MLLLLQPEYFWDECLRIPFGVMGRKEFAKIIGKDERTLRNWQIAKVFPDGAWGKFTDFLNENGNNRVVSLLEQIKEKPQYMEVAGHQWKLFNQSLLGQDDFFLKKTLTEINFLADSDIEFVDSILNFSNEDKFIHYKEYLQNTVGKIYEMSDSWIDSIEKTDNFKSLKNSISTVAFESILYILAIADVECCVDRGLKKSILNRYIPTYADEKSINSPVEIFFRTFFDSLIEEGHFSNQVEIAKYISCKKGNYTEKKSAEREMRRAMNSAHVPNWNTLRNWVLAVLESEKLVDKVDHEAKMILLRKAEDIYGGVRILDWTLKEHIKNCPGQNPLEFFSHYVKWFDRHFQEFTTCGDVENHAPAES